MQDQLKTKAQLIKELAELREHVAALQALVSERQQTEQVQREGRQHYHQEMEALQRISLAVNTTLDLNAVLQRLIAETTTLLAAGNASVVFCDTATGEAEVTTSYGGDAALRVLRYPLAGSLVGWVAEHKRPLRVFRITPEEWPTSWQLGEQLGEPPTQVSVLLVPLWVQGEVVGSLEAVWEPQHLITDHEEQLLEAVAAQAAIAISNARLYQEKEQALQEARMSEERFRLMADSAPVMVWMSGPDALCTFFSQPWLAFTGRTLEQEMGNGWTEDVCPDDLQHYLDTYLSAFQAHHLFRMEYRLRRADGEYRWVLDTGIPRFAPDGGFAGYIGSCIDITDRKRAEEALRESETRYRGLVESQQDLIVRVDPQGRFTFVNDAFCRKFGKRREELVGATFMPMVHEDDLPATLGAMKALEVPPYRIAVEQRTRAPEGLRWIAWEDYAIRDEQGRIVEVQAVGRDITERKQTEEERQRLQQQLFRMQKLDALGTLAGGIAHDFNNILSAILGYTDLAMDEVPPGTVAWKNLEEVLKASRRAKGLVQQILTFSRSSQQPDRQPIQLQPVVEDTLSLLRASLPKNVQIRSRRSAPAETLLADPVQMQQVLMNLCVNAAQAMQDKGGVVDVSLERVERGDVFDVTRKSLEPQPHLKLTVCDTGCGMVPEVMERIFEPFFTTKPVGEGSGMGLAIAHAIVTSHGGTITVESQPNHGTTFQVYVPLCTNSVEAENPPGARVTLEGSRELVVNGRGFPKTAQGDL